ncbi:hypothetical protein LTR09_009488 [Extremus antarcticus]|uniref:Uncharacterized protein n=1 Tax=Extremus antarcticus TaxID=702011 RepID=A0AAJ0G679_9PEZI|nr:hypothetical protein LTR09_009488 [Extremus antarcticus]
MASHSANASRDDIEEDLEFQAVLIDSLDTGAEDYLEKLAELEDKKADLERRLQEIGGSGQSQTSAGPSQQTPTQNMNNGWQQMHDGGLSSNNGFYSSPTYGGQYQQNNPNAMKRTHAQSLQEDQYQYHPSKRPTPEPSNAGTPASSTGSFELVERPSDPNMDSIERARRRQLEYEAGLRIRQQSQIADEEYARSMQQPPPSSQMPSSSRPSIQTTLNYGGSYQRPPPRPQNSMQANISPPAFSTPRNFTPQSHSPYIKPEPGSSRQYQQLPQRSGHAEVIDLTNSDEDDEVTEVARTTPSNRMLNHHAHPNGIPPAMYAPQRPAHIPYGNAPAVQPAQSYQMPHHMPPPSQLQRSAMPGSYPTTNSNGNQYVYGNPNPTTIQSMQGNSSWMQNNPMLTAAMSGVRNVAGMLGDPLTELNNLINGSGYGQQYPAPVADEDDDLIFGGSRPLQPGHAQAPYAGHEDLRNRRVEDILNYDPTKTTEEINALLDNIRPDEEMPPHLRVSTPKAMSIMLHKYQELGLTWLKSCEEGSNKGGVLADDMGLGKTIQMLSLIVERKSEDPRCKATLIVAPLALMRQWKQEIESKIKSSHRLSVYVQHGPSKKKDFRDLQHFDVVLTTYGSLGVELKRLERHTIRMKMYPDSNPRPNSDERCALLGDDARWYRVILDEAQCIKNHKIQTSKAACYLRAEYRFCMTGTPMMNGVDEYFSLIKFLRIRPYNEWTKFRLDISAPLKQSHDYGKDRAMQKLQALLKATMLRRTKKSEYEGKPILTLPERVTEVNNPVFSDDEQAFYRALEDRSQLQFNRYLAAGTVGKSYSAILVLLLRLRQACCHPHLIRDFGIAAAAGVAPEELTNLAKELSPAVVARIKETEVCYDAVTNPAIFLPCGHDTCRECFAKIADPSNAIRDGNEGASSAKCPTCRSAVDPKRITDFDSFKKVYMPDLLSAEDKAELEKLKAELDAGDDSETDSDDSDTESDDDVDAKGNLLGFIVNDDEDLEEASVDGDDEIEVGASESSKKPEKSMASKPKQSKKAKGKKKEKVKAKAGTKTVTLADLKKLASRNAKARKAYMKRLRSEWMTSAKIEKTLEILREIMDDPEGEKVLIFSQWTSLLDLLEVPIDGEHWGYRRYDGSMSATMRNDAVDDFRDERKNVRIMLVSLKAGNAGLNLNMASHVIILDPFWNPYIEEQAIDRAHRLGQTREVRVHRMLIKDTVEDRIIALQDKKREIISTALDEKAAQEIGRLGIQELAFLFGISRTVNQRVQYAPRNAR